MNTHSSLPPPSTLPSSKGVKNEISKKKMIRGSNFFKRSVGEIGRGETNEMQRS